MVGIPGMIAGIGFRAIAGGLLGKAAGAGGSALKWLGSLDLIHMLALVLAIGWGVDHLICHRHVAKVEHSLTSANHALTVTRADLATSRANEAALKKAIADQNAAIADLGTTSATQQKIASRASQAAAQRAREAEATAERLRRSSRSGAGKSGPAACEPSDTLIRQWS